MKQLQRISVVTKKKVGVICAMQEEAASIISVMESTEERIISGIKFTDGVINGISAVVAVCGIGKVFAAMCTEAMILTYSPEVIINSGVGGALSPNLSIGDIVVAKYAIQHDMDTSAIGDPKGLISGINIIELPCAYPTEFEEFTLTMNGRPKKIVSGVVASGDKFVSEIMEKRQIGTFFGADVCEMEGGAIAQVCYAAKLPCVIVRSVSDTLSGGSMDYMEFKSYACEASFKMISRLFGI